MESSRIAPFWGQDLRILLSVVPYIVMPLAFRPGTRLRFADDRAELLSARGNVELTLYLTEGRVPEEVDARHFTLAGMGRNTFEITDETGRFRVVGTTNAPKPVVVEEA